MVSGEWVRCLNADYEGTKVDFAGKIVKVEVDGASWEAVVKVTGTRSEELLKFCTSVEKPRVQAQMCRVDCDRKRTNPNLVHLRTVQRISPEEALTWETNCEGTDELPGLRAAQGWAERANKEKDKEKVDSSSSSNGKAKKKKKSKKKEKKNFEKKKGKRWVVEQML